MLIIEGPDGAGKSTLVEQFKRAGLPQVPRAVGSDTKALVDLRVWVDNQLDAGFTQRVYDRISLISAPIYGPIMRKTPEKGFSELAWMGPRIRRFYDLEPIIIYCLPPKDVVMRNVFGDPDNQVIADYIERIYAAYVAKAAYDCALSPGVVKIYDYTRTPAIEDKPLWFNSILRTLKRKVTE